MRIREILDFETTAEEESDLLMQKISNAFTRHGEVKGLLSLGHTGGTGLYSSPSAVPEPDHDAALDLAGMSPTPTRRLVPNRHRVAGPKLAQVSSSNFPTSAIDMAHRRHS